MSVTNTSKHYFGSGTPYYYGKMTLTTSTSNTSVTVSWKVELIQKYGSYYGVGVKISGSASGSATGYATSTQSSEHTICSKSGSVTFSRSTSAQTKSFTVTAYGTTVSGYGSAGGSVSASASVSVPALASYTIAYDVATNGGSNKPGNQTKYYGTALKLQTTIPTKTNYTFVGWNTSSTATSATYSAGGSYTANASATLYAIFKRTLTLSYSANDGSGAPSSQSATIYNNTTSYSFNIPTAKPTRAGYNFLGWATSASATSASKQPGDSYSISSNTTLYAVWQVAYVPPKITNIVAYRVNVDGQPDDTESGTYMHLSFNWSIDGDHATMSGVPKPIIIGARKRGDNGWIILDRLDAYGTSGSVSKAAQSGPGESFNPDYTYDILIVVRDNKDQSSYTTFLSAAYFTMDVKSDGRGIAFGTSAINDGFKVAMPASFDSTVTLGVAPTDDMHAATKKYTDDTFVPKSSVEDYIIATGSSGNWYYRKWNSGTLECWGRKQYTLDVNNTAGQLKYKALDSIGSYPIAFISYPTVTITGTVTNGNGWVVGNNTNYSQTSCGGLYVYAPFELTSAGVTANVYAIGRWK